ncbi:MAG: hypothetical protein K9J37_10015 [Saprospiraceae bacterium]|nr:hypothetical protein [Saprospiraceae bacterium]MCF8250237.1 hypothetical protein [Saprospiraceae bacterium]MCF8280000.1 hypothetical protein [Bacteroidales bacterium]MCF8312045.1 hypothetical protein [Saprospiraceae bacterium]MCF8441142.1 hypothetical protein [Saprospiraceae bacterium]
MFRILIFTGGRAAAISAAAPTCQDIFIRHVVRKGASPKLLDDEPQGDETNDSADSDEQ